MKPWRTLQQLSALSLLAVLAACSGGGGGSNTSSGGSGKSDTLVIDSLTASLDVTSLQWGVPTPVSARLQNDDGTRAKGPLTCRVDMPTALAVNSDSSSLAKAWRLGSLALVACDSQGQRACLCAPCRSVTP